MTHVDDLVQRRKQQVFLAIIRGLLVAFPNDHAIRESRIAQKKNPKTQESEVQHLAFLQNATLYQDHFCLFLRPNRILHGRLQLRAVYVL
jgi:hypothetical protein